MPLAQVPIVNGYCMNSRPTWEECRSRKAGTHLADCYAHREALLDACLIMRVTQPKRRLLMSLSSSTARTLASRAVWKHSLGTRTSEWG